MESVVTRESICIKAQRDYARGIKLDDCPLPVSSDAARTWREEWRRLDAERRMKVVSCAT